MRDVIKDSLTACAILACLIQVLVPARAQEQEQPALQILVIGGEGSINNVKQRTAREPIVEVRDRNNRPVAGAAVLFEAPRSGASGTFTGGSSSLRVTTDVQGRAVGQGFHPNTSTGEFAMQVTATFEGVTAAVTIHMRNVAPVAVPNAAKGGVLHGKLIAVVAAVGAAAAVGAVAATHGGGGGGGTNAGNTPPAPTTISLGTGSVGPHP
jgi:hypothetical protein